MGTVYRAFDQALNRSVALKLLRKEYSANPGFVEQFQREAAITASINHPNVVKVYSSGTDHRLVYIAMELVDKGSLDDLLTLQGRVAEMQVLEVGAQIARGLDAALRGGLIHRDVKPGNILFADAHTSKIVDFGLATLHDQALKGGGEIWGTPYYVAPEKLNTPPREDFRSDLYSLGATLFHALAGRPPFEAESASLVALKHLKSEAVSLQAFAPDVSTATAFVINKTLSKNPEDRYQNYEELAQNLDYARGELLKQGGGAKPQRSRVVLESEDDTRAMSWITFGMVAVMVLGGLGVWLMRDKLFGGSEPKGAAAVDQAKKRMDELQPEFKAAREMIVRGDAANAARNLEQLEDQADVPQPLLNWVTLHVGLSHLLAQNEPESRKAFRRLGGQSMFGRSAEDRKLSQYFIDLGRQLEGDQPVLASVAKDIDKSGYESISLLLYALKDWQLGKYDDAAALFRQFRSTTPEAPYQWVADYKELAAPYISDSALVQSLLDRAKAAKTPAKQREIIDSLHSAKNKLKVKSGLAKRLEHVTKKIEQALAADDTKKQEKTADAENVDAPHLAEAKKKCAALVAQYRFIEAKTAAEELKVTSEKHRTEQRALLAHMTALAKFKTQLVHDMSIAGYNGKIVRRNGAAIPAGRFTATDANVELRSAFGTVPIPWADVSPDSLIAAAKSFIKADLPSDAAADRNWELGIYALTMGRKDVAHELIALAVQAKPEYSDAKQLIETTIPGGIQGN
jgi:hypothetical protein